SGDRPVAQITAYDSLGRVAWVEDGATNRTSFAYDSIGRRIAVTNALGQVTHTAYDLEDRVIATWGATYPVAYEFDSFGRMTAMATTRDDTSDFSTLAVQLAAGQSIMSIGSTWSLDTTQWLYDEPTGALTNKLYSDGKGPSYTYTADGKLETRNWARGVTTTYTYDDCCAGGSLKSVVYSDGTPGFTNTHDRLGRVVTVLQGGSGVPPLEHHYAYDPATLALTSETVIANGQTNVLTRTHDNFGRASGLTVAGVGDPGDPPYAIAYGHDPLGRFSAVTSTIADAINTFTYAYLPGADLIASVSNNLGQVTARTYETHRDFITTIENTWGTNQISRFDYTNDALGRRTARQDSGAAFASTWTNAFAYNLRSEIEEAIMRNGESNYEFDPIGNRLIVLLPEEPSPYLYQSNELNQYLSITNGIASAPSHDDDGNMLSGPAGTGHAELQFVWDGENRLIQVSSNQFQVSFTYDSQSRRVRKQVLENGNPTKDIRFLYDGWLLVREQSAAGGNVTTNHYVWGLDLSQTMQGAGGIGGLLSVTASTNGTFSTCFDANGNISEYIALTDGSITAHQEYDAFGRVIASTGTAPCPVGFSTKYEDAETGLLYYGYRFYSPELGRWLSRDLIGEYGGNNIYCSTDNAMINLIDLHGMLIIEGGCCCPEEVTQHGITTELRRPDVMGHEFSVYVKLIAKRSSVCGPCKLIWEEHTNDPYATGMSANTWTDMYDLWPTSVIFKPWRDKIIAVPENDSMAIDTIILNDAPKVGFGSMTIAPPGALSPEGFYTRDLKIRVTVEKTPGCDCDSGKDKLTSEWNQRLRGVVRRYSIGGGATGATKGWPLWEQSYFQ
ncbi:MAG: RHS repeat-associated core domain-containing protein, partial [Kiritimatiellia bacterium]|nr:RHS repeat-associated core domain-containing protein [Kiritimatiellia bacterium]